MQKESIEKLGEKIPELKEYIEVIAIMPSSREVTTPKCFSQVRSNNSGTVPTIRQSIILALLSRAKSDVEISIFTRLFEMALMF